MRLIIILILLCFAFFGMAQNVTYSKDIAPIIQRHCTSCHQKGEVAPIPFTTYAEVSSYASMIAFVTRTKYMPPWKPVHHPKHRFELERGLTDQEIHLIQEWIDNGLQKGDLENDNLIANKENLEISAPDVVYAMAEPFEQYGVYYDQFRVFVIPTEELVDREITSIAFVPGNKSIVRSCQISIDTTSKSQALDAWDPQYGYFSFGALGFVPMESRWYNWQPGKPVTDFPEGTGKRLPKGSKILMHIHYGPTGFPQKDSSFLQIKFAKKKIKQAIYTASLISPYNMTNDSFFIPENEDVRVHAKFEVPFDIALHGLFPHSHLLGKRWEVFTVDPETKSSEVLLKIEDWDFKWKQMYDFKEPKVLKKGTVVHALAAYDNTLENLSNPSNPPRKMPWGKRMFEELFLVFFKFSEVPSNNTNPIVEIDLKQVNVSSSKIHFDILASKKSILKAAIKSFDGKQQLSLFTNKVFKDEKISVEVSLADLPKGNYYIEIEESSTGLKKQRVFLYAEDALFE